MPSERDFDVPEDVCGDGWRAHRRGLWTLRAPVDVVLPRQGWKVHVSAGPDNAERVLARVAKYCDQHAITFKHLRNLDLLLVYNSKYAPRAASGKFITAYPGDVSELQAMLEELGTQLLGERGPYVLSDLRWGSGPLHVRYGGFRERYLVDENGGRVHAIERPDGRLVPDSRRPVFRVPEWLDIPDFLESHVASRRGGGGRQQMNYRIERSLHFSNGGGVYVGRRPGSTEELVLKEARPGAGLDRNGRDATARLTSERDVLRRLDGVPGVPRVRDWFTAWEHLFLVMDLQAGDILWKWVGRHHPLIDAVHDHADVAAYVTRALALVDRVEELLHRVHERGVIIGDLHPANLLVDDEDRVARVDFEAAGDSGDAPFGAPLGAPGFASWSQNKTGEAIDRHALAALRLWIFLPMNAVWALAPAKIAQCIDEVERRFPVPDGYCRALREELCPGGTPRTARPPVELDVDQPDLLAACTSLVRGILAGATPERTDRLFPGDVAQFAHGGLGFANGAAGVLWALSMSGIPADTRHHEDWLVDAAHRQPDPAPGFGSGLAGVAFTLLDLGRREIAHDLLSRAVESATEIRRAGLFHGLSGIGLTLLHGASNGDDPSYLDRAVVLADRVRLDLRRPVDDARPAGLLHGWSGAALFLLRVAEATGDDSWLADAVAALHRDLDRCVTTRNGSLQVEEPGNRTLAYLAGGSGGIAVVAAELLAHCDDPRARECLAPVRLACSPEFVAEPQLFNGRAGLLAVLCQLTGTPADPGAGRALARHVRRLDWHALEHRGELAFPGERCLRLSSDLATGSAGILLALTAARCGSRWFPFLGPPAAGSAGQPAGQRHQRGLLIRPGLGKPDHEEGGERRAGHGA